MIWRCHVVKWASERLQVHASSRSCALLSFGYLVEFTGCHVSRPSSTALRPGAFKCRFGWQQNPSIHYNGLSFPLKHSPALDARRSRQVQRGPSNYFNVRSANLANLVQASSQYLEGQSDLLIPNRITAYRQSIFRYCSRQLKIEEQSFHDRNSVYSWICLTMWTEIIN